MENMPTDTGGWSPGHGQQGRGQGSREGAALVAQTLKNLLAMGQTWVQPLGREDPLQVEMTIHSSVLASWRIPWTEKPTEVGAQPP